MDFVDSMGYGDHLREIPIPLSFCEVRNLAPHSTAVVFEYVDIYWWTVKPLNGFYLEAGKVLPNVASSARSKGSKVSDTKNEGRTVIPSSVVPNRPLQSERKRMSPQGSKEKQLLCAAQFN